MHKEPNRDIAWETAFFESILKRDKSYALVIEILGNLYTQQGRIEDGLKMDRRLVRLEPDNSTAHYNLACSLALVKRKPDALRTLKKAIELGYTDYVWMAKDKDLDCIKDHPEFATLLESLRTSAKAK
jgi:tetratricopeptide (TPR) repeat protein